MYQETTTAIYSVKFIADDSIKNETISLMIVIVEYFSFFSCERRTHLVLTFDKLGYLPWVWLCGLLFLFLQQVVKDADEDEVAVTLGLSPVAACNLAQASLSLQGVRRFLEHFCRWVARLAPEVLHVLNATEHRIPLSWQILPNVKRHEAEKYQDASVWTYLQIGAIFKPCNPFKVCFALLKIWLI